MAKNKNNKVPVQKSKNVIPKPQISHASKETLMAFGFKYFKQIDNFGLKEQDTSYFIGILEALQHYSNISISQFQTCPHIKYRSHIHEVNWNAKNIPLKKTDIDWVPELENEDIVLWCFSTHGTGGRCVGFFDFNDIMQIVLLDPEHNLQPSKDYNYKVNDTSIGNSCFDYAKIQLESVLNAQCDDKNCITYQVQENYKYSKNIKMIVVPDDYHQDIDQLKSTGDIECPTDLFYYGIHFLNDKNS